MPLPPDLSVSVFICEKALREADGILSAIRLVDVFLVSRPPDVPVEQQIVQMHVVAVIRSQTITLGRHTIRLDLLRPNGERRPGPEQIEATIDEPNFPAPRGISLAAQVGVVAKQQGTHWWILQLDDEEIARAPFTLLELKPTSPA